MTPIIIIAPPLIIFGLLDENLEKASWTTYSFSSAHPIAKSQDKDGAKQTSNLVDSCNEALIHTVVLCAWEVSIEGIRGNDSRHHSLVISEE